jgi:uncharacterized protein YhdP
MSLPEEERGKLRTAVRLIREVLGDDKTKIDAGMWRSLPPTEPQIEVLKRGGYAVDVNRGQAIDIIENLKKRRKGSGHAASGNSGH